MPDSLALPVVLDELERRIAMDNCEPQDLRQVLRAMQRAGLSRTDIEVHLERARATNDATTMDPRREENCLVGLSLVTGEMGDLSLAWDARALAQVYVPKVVNKSRVAENLAAALAPSDMLPVRPGELTDKSVLMGIPDQLVSHLQTDAWVPLRCDEFRVPKGPFTTRPAALLAFADRIVFEVLASLVERPLSERLPRQVHWPRSRDARPDPAGYREAPTSWPAPYVVKADIAGFYEAVDHSLLAVVIASRLGCSSDAVHAIEHFLGAVMGGETGLPQGPLASDLLASAYLIVIDEELVARGWDFVRFADDFLIGAESMADGREKLEELEAMLSDYHLRLNDSKTMVMRHTTYVDGLEQPARQLVETRAAMLRGQGTYLANSEDPDVVAEVLVEFGADEQMLFDVLYHGTTSIEDAIRQLSENLDPGAASVRLNYLRRTDARLAGESPGEDLTSVFGPVRDSIAYMAAAQDIEALGAVERLLSWFPGLGPVASVYLESVWRVAERDVDDVVVRLLTPDELPDWTASWVCRAAQKRDGVLSSQLLDRLRTIVRSERHGPLARMTSVWALAAHRELTLELWTAAVGRATPAQLAELWLAASGDPAGYLASRQDALPS